MGDNTSPKKEDSFTPHAPGSIERLFQVKYRIDAGETQGCDQYVLSLPNSLHIVGLSYPYHKLFDDVKANPSLKVKKVDFKPNKIDFREAKVTGKRKRNGGIDLRMNTPICKIILSDDSEYIFYSGINGTMLEVNKVLVDNPNLIIERPMKEGHIAIIKPNKNLGWGLLSKKDYLSAKNSTSNEEEIVIKEESTVPLVEEKNVNSEEAVDPVVKIENN